MGWLDNHLREFAANERGYGILILNSSMFPPPTLMQTKKGPECLPGLHHFN
jgi:hypothetical protein